MKIVYSINKVGKKRKFILSRTTKQRWHLIRTLTTQLVEHERIRTTSAKAKHLQPTIERLLQNAKKAEFQKKEHFRKKVNIILTSEKARKKLWEEIIPRIENEKNRYTFIKKLDRKRKGDNAEMSYIEIKGKFFKKSY